MNINALRHGPRTTTSQSVDTQPVAPPTARRRRARRVAVALAFLALQAPSLGHAQSHAAAAASPPPAASLAESLSGQAKIDYEAGKLLFNDGDFSGAMVKFSSAYAASKEPRLLWNMAACEKNRRRYASAIELIRRYKTEGAAALSPEDAADADEAVRTLQPLTGQVRVRADQRGAAVFVDDVLVGETPLERPIFVDLGEHRVRLAKEGFREATASVTVAGGDEKPLDFALLVAKAEGKVSIRAHAGDAVAIDGKVVASGSWDGLLPVGPHHLRVSAPGKRTHDADFLVEDGQSQLLSVTLESEKKGIPAWAWIAGGVLVTSGAAVGGYFLFRPGDPVVNPPVGTLAPGSVQASFPGRSF